MDSILPDIQPRALNAPMTSEELLIMLRNCDIPRISSQDTLQYIQDAEHDVDLFEKCIHRLRARQAALKRDISRYRSLSSPIRKLPPEVLRRIFGFASDQSYFGIICNSASFRLSSVCSRWRDVALHSPELWADICVSLDYEKAFKPAQLSLARSHTHPLALKLEGGQEIPPESDELLSLLYRHCDRWREVDLTEMCMEYIEDTMAPFGDTPLLKSAACHWGLADRIVGGIISDAPRLCSIKLRSSDTVHHLDMDNDCSPALETFLEALRRGSKLESIFLHGLAGLILNNGRQDVYMSLSEPVKPVVSNISSLSARLSNAQSFSNTLYDMFRSTTLPSLQTLELCLVPAYEFLRKKDYHFPQGLHPPTFHAFLERSNCNITTLALEGMNLSDRDVINLLQHTRSLHTFTLCELWATTEFQGRPEQRAPVKSGYQIVTKSFLKHLGATTLTADAFSTQQPLVPKLKYLKLGVQSHFDADEVFVDMVKSRWESTCGDMCSSDMKQLRTVVLHVVHGELEKGVYEPLKRIDREGMMISVFGNGERVI
ncbi:hypothetical protein PQX77_005371 [Marasmius sp. AFHP31]|nr:hypothetical protein PQX77_005371 [Marasmius sp. AFHP31]